MARSLRRLAAALPFGVAAVTLAGVLAGCGSPRNPAAVPAPGRDAVPAAEEQSVATAGGTTVVVNCLSRLQVRPSSFVLTCADANDFLTGMHWVNWASGAFAIGTEKISNCTPNCAGRFISYPVLVALWRPVPLPNHRGVLHFSRVTRIYRASDRRSITAMVAAHLRVTRSPPPWACGVS